MRFICKLAVLLAVGILMTATLASAQQPQALVATPTMAVDWSKVQVKTTNLGHGFYMLEGQGGNVLFAVGQDGVIMIDGQWAEMHDKLKAAIKAVTPLKVTYLINTHHHPDHTYGNMAFAAEGTIIVGQQNQLLYLSTERTDVNSFKPVLPLDPTGRPTIVFKDSLSVEIKGVKAELQLLPPAHTGGDIMVYFPQANILHVGDVIRLNRYPSIDYFSGGTINGLIGSCEAVMARADDNTVIVVGHGDLTRKAEVAKLHKLLVSARDKVQALIAAGKTEAQIVNLKPLADFDPAWLGGEAGTKTFIRMIYATLKK